MFCNEHNLPKGIVPSLAEFRRANRFDLKHAVERWGGLREVADLLEYEVRMMLVPSPSPCCRLRWTIARMSGSEDFLTEEQEADFLAPNVR